MMVSAFFYFLSKMLMLGVLFLKGVAVSFINPIIAIGGRLNPMATPLWKSFFSINYFPKNSNHHFLNCVYAFASFSSYLLAAYPAPL